MPSCAFCKTPIEGEHNFSIHRDGMDQGPEVPLCDACGGEDGPTCEEIWAVIAAPTPLLPDVARLGRPVRGRNVQELWRA